MRFASIVFLALAAGHFGFAASVTDEVVISGIGSGYTNAGGVNDPATNIAFNNQVFSINLFLDPNSYANDLQYSAASVLYGQLVLSPQSGIFTPGPLTAFSPLSLSVHGDGSTDMVELFNTDPLNPGTLQELLLSGPGFNRQLVYSPFGPIDVSASFFSDFQDPNTIGDFRILTSFGLVDFSGISNTTLETTAVPESSTRAIIPLAALFLLSACLRARRPHRLKASPQ